MKRDTFTHHNYLDTPSPDADLFAANPNGIAIRFADRYAETADGGTYRIEDQYAILVPRWKPDGTVGIAIGFYFSSNHGADGWAAAIRWSPNVHTIDGATTVLGWWNSARNWAVEKIGKTDTSEAWKIEREIVANAERLCPIHVPPTGFSPEVG